MLLGLSFDRPGRLWLLVAVGVLALSYLLLQARRGRYAVRFTNLALLESVAPSRPGWRRHLPAVLFLVALAGLVAGFARPMDRERVPRERATIVVAIDTSLSMEATDVAPNRIEAAKAAAKDFIRLLPAKLNVGLVTFNGTATIKVPPTTDRDQIVAAIDQIRLGERTAIGEAIYASLDAIQNAPGMAEVEDGEPVPARIVLMSDGTTTVGRPDAQAAAQAKRDGVPVSTIAFGTPEGTIHIDGQAEPVRVDVDTAALEAIANATNGTFFEAATADQLRQVYADIGSSIGYTSEDRDVSDRFIGASLVALLLAAVGSQLWFSRLP